MTLLQCIDVTEKLQHTFEAKVPELQVRGGTRDNSAKFFLFPHQKICFDSSSELSQRDCSNDVSKYMFIFWKKIRKIIPTLTPKVKLFSTYGYVYTVTRFFNMLCFIELYLALVHMAETHSQARAPFVI